MNYTIKFTNQGSFKVEVTDKYGVVGFGHFSKKQWAMEYVVSYLSSADKRKKERDDLHEATLKCIELDKKRGINY